MILIWDFLDCVLDWLKLIYVKFHVLFWMFGPLLTLGLELVVWTYHLGCGFQVKKHIAMIGVAHSLELIKWLILTNFELFCRLMPSYLCCAHWLVPCTLLAYLSDCVIDCLFDCLNCGFQVKKHIAMIGVAHSFELIS